MRVHYLRLPIDIKCVVLSALCCAYSIVLLHLFLLHFVSFQVHFKLFESSSWVIILFCSLIRCIMSRVSRRITRWCCTTKIPYKRLSDIQSHCMLFEFKIAALRSSFALLDAFKCFFIFCCRLSTVGCQISWVLLSRYHRCHISVPYFVNIVVVRRIDVVHVVCWCSFKVAAYFAIYCPIPVNRCWF